MVLQIDIVTPKSNLAISNQEHEFGVSSECCPQTTNFRYKKIHIEKQNTLLIAYYSPCQAVIKLIVEGVPVMQTNKTLFRIPILIAISFWYCKVNSLDRNFIDILKIVTRANEHKRL